MSNEDYQKKQLTYARVRTVLLAAILLLLLVVGVYAMGTLRDMHRTVDLLEQKVERIDMEDINAIVNAVRDVTAQLKELNVGEAVDALERAAELLAGVDVETLNGAIASLRDAAGKLGNVDTRTLNNAISSLRDAANTLKDLDIGALNSVIRTLEDTTDRLQEAVDKAVRIANFFG